MNYEIKYWTRDELESGEAKITSEPLTLKIIEDPDDLGIDSLCHDLKGNAWKVEEIIRPNGKSEINFVDSGLIPHLVFLENLANEEDWVIFILEKVEPIAVSKPRPKPNQKPPQPSSTKKLQKRELR